MILKTIYIQNIDPNFSNSCQYHGNLVGCETGVNNLEELPCIQEKVAKVTDAVSPPERKQLVFDTASLFLPFIMSKTCNHITKKYADKLYLESFFPSAEKNMKM